MIRLRLFVAALSASLSLSAVSAVAQVAPPVDARTLAMGNTGLWSRDDAALFFNPAQLAVAKGVSASGEGTNSDLARRRSAAVAGATAFGKGGVGIGATTSSAGDPRARSSGSLAVAGIGQTIKSFRVGASVKYETWQYDSLGGARTTLDLGVAHDFAKYFTAGLAIKDRPLTRGFASGGLDLAAGVAGGGPVGPLDVVAALETYPRAGIGGDALDGGAEASWSWLSGYAIAVRAGSVAFTGKQSRRNTAGVGFTRDRLSIDYALEQLGGSALGHRIGIRIR